VHQEKGAAAVFRWQKRMFDRCWDCFAQLGKSAQRSGSADGCPDLPIPLEHHAGAAQFTLQQALAGLAAQAPDSKPDKPMLLKLAEHVAIRFALDSYEKGELRVTPVKQLLDRMNTEIEALRKNSGHAGRDDGACGTLGAVVHGAAGSGLGRVPEKTRRKC